MMPRIRTLATRATAIVCVAVMASAGLSGLSGPASAATWSSCARHASRQFGNYHVNNNEWNNSAGRQCIWATSYHHWGVTSTQSGTAVKTYPNTQRLFDNSQGQYLKPVGSFTSMVSTYSEYMPSNGIFESAYDIWLNNWNIELMIWQDNHGQVPFGHRAGNATIYGNHYTVWQSGNDAFAFVLDHNARWGKVHIKSVFNWMVRNNKITNATTLTDVEFGFEVCSTAGQPEKFRLNRYTLKWTR